MDDMDWFMGTPRGGEMASFKVCGKSRLIKGGVVDVSGLKAPQRFFVELSEQEHLNASVRYLDASRCGLTEFPPLSLPYLEILDLSKNYIRHLSLASLEQMRRRLPSLKHLYLAGNPLPRVLQAPDARFSPWHQRALAFYSCMGARNAVVYLLCCFEYEPGCVFRSLGRDVFKLLLQEVWASRHDDTLWGTANDRALFTSC